MKFALSTLKKFFKTNCSVEEICQKLTQIGFEVENIEDKAQNLKSFSVAEIVDCVPHPNSTKLKICSVRTCDNPNPLQIVCGAANARSGIKVAYAPINSIIPNSLMVIKKAKIAGIESNGMLCSAAELNLDIDDNGIIEIDNNIELGSKIADVFGVNDVIIEIHVTPNRSDCLSVYGIARDLAASGIGTLKDLEQLNFTNQQTNDFNINNQSENCLNYNYLTIKNIKNNTSPSWLSKALNNISINSINAIVDCLNYTMHLFNQPMHCYDLDKIGKQISIKNATNSQNFISLKNINYQLDDNMLAIHSNDKIISVAGVIGSIDSGVLENTKSVLLESCFFTPDSVCYSGKKLNILSDARQRFEKGIDIDQCKNALHYAAKLILEICGGEISQTVSEHKALNNKIIKFDFAKFYALTGINIDQNLAFDILRSLKFTINNNLEVKVPSWRHDINYSEDLVEEILRIYGYYQIPKINIKNNSLINKANNPLHKIRFTLANRGFIETMSWSFVDEKLAKNFTTLQPSLILKNPISQEMNYMRPNLAIGLLNSYQKNYLRNTENLSLCEIGNIFLNHDQQTPAVAGLRVGKNFEQDHYQDQRDFDFYDVKKDLFETLETIGIKADSLQISTESPPSYYHPHRFANFKLGKNIIGYCGEIHPQISKIYNFKNKQYLFEIYLNSIQINISKNVNKKTLTLNDFPLVERDYAFILDQNIMVGDLIKTIYSTDKNTIKNVNIFDIYQGKNIEDGKKSVALRVKIQSNEKTLTSEEIDIISKNIIDNIQQRYEARLRDGL